MVEKVPKSNFNLSAMTKYLVKTHRPGVTYNAPHFFILNKGLNSGKPLQSDCANCFVLLFDNIDKREEYYWMAYSLWQSNYWHVALVGSVIPFLRINDFNKVFMRKTERMLLDFSRHRKQIQALRLLQEKESFHNENVKLIKQMRSAILTWYVKA